MTLPFSRGTGGTSVPGSTTVANKNLKIYSPSQPEVVQYDITDSDFHNGFQIATGYKIAVSVRSMSSSYDEGQTLIFSTSEDWSAPSILPGSRVEFYARISDFYSASKQPAWVANAGGGGVTLLFSGKIDDIELSGDVESGSGVTYTCRGWLFWGNSVDISLTLGNGFRIPERIYNVDTTDDPAEYKRSIKKSSAAVPGSFYNYAPFGSTGITAPDTTHVTGLEQNLNSNKMMTVGEIIKDLFGSHGKQLKVEGCAPSNWNHTTGTGTVPFVQAELDGMTIVPDKIVFADTKFTEALRALLRKCYPNYAIWVDRSKIWHFTPILDNLDTTAQSSADVYAPPKWLASRLGYITLKLAEPAGEGDVRVFGKLVRGSISHRTSDRFTAVRIVGSEIVTTSEASTLNGTLKPAWGNGSPAQQVNLQASYYAGGLESSVHRHWDRGDANNGIPVYKVELVSGTTLKFIFRGYQSELWPHTNDEWNGTSMLLAPSLGAVRGSTWVWTTNAQKFTILDSYNVSNIGDGTPGYAVEIDSRNQITVASVDTEVTLGNGNGSHIQLTDDLGISTTLSPNQLSVTHRMFQIVETSTEIGSSINSNPGTPCTIRAVVPLGPGRSDSPNGGVPGLPGGNGLEQFGQSLGGTAVSMLGRLHSQASGRGDFWFGGKLIIPFSALRNAQAKHTGSAGIPDFCKRGGVLPAQEIKVIYEKSTSTYFETRVPALANNGDETYAGTAFIVAGVRRELLIRSDRFIDQSQATEFQNLATMILRTVSDMEPNGSGWEWLGASRYFSMIDLHFRLDVDFYRTFGIGGSAPFGIQQAVVTRIDYDFENDVCLMSLDTRYNPLGSYSYDGLQDALISAKRLKSIEESRNKAQRTADCLNSLGTYKPTTTDFTNPVCQDHVVRSSGPGRGKPAPPVACHATDDLINTGDGITVPVASGSAPGYATSERRSDVNLSAGIGWMLEPFRDTTGRLFFYDRFGAVQAGDHTALVPGESEHPNAKIAAGDPGWQGMPLRKSQDMAEVALLFFKLMIGMDAAIPAQTNYNTISDYDSVTGAITLTYDNLISGAYNNGAIFINDGPEGCPYVEIDNNTDGTVFIKNPGSFPTGAEIRVGAHVYIVAQRKPLPDSSFAAGTKMFKDSLGDWYAVEPDGQFYTPLISGSTDFVPKASNDGPGSPKFTTIPTDMLPP